MRGTLAGTIHHTATETFGANEVQPRRTSFHTKCFHSGEETTKVMKIIDVPQESVLFFKLHL